MSIHVHTTMQIELRDDAGAPVTTIPVTPEFLQAVAVYLDAVSDWTAGNTSYSVIEIPVMDIGWAVLATIGSFPPKHEVPPPQAQVPSDGPPVRQVISPMRRARILARDGLQCVQCGSTTDLALDHKMPISKGGTNDDDNLQTLCRSCNSSKRDRLPAPEPEV